MLKKLLIIIFALSFTTLLSQNQYRATVSSVEDGDTYFIDIELPDWNSSTGELTMIRRDVKVRLWGCDTPSVSTEGGVIAKVMVTQLLHNLDYIIIERKGKDELNRNTVEIWLPDGQTLYDWLDNLCLLTGNGEDVRR